MHQIYSFICVVGEKIEQSEEQRLVGLQKLQLKRNDVDALRKELEELTKLDKFVLLIREFRAKIYWYHVYAAEQQVVAAQDVLQRLRSKYEECVQVWQSACSRVETLGSLESLQQAVEAQEREVQLIQQEVDAKSADCVKIENDMRAMQGQIRSAEGEHKSNVDACAKLKSEVSHSALS
jgi:hypothetical protein